jgi:hypothetical protein
VFIADHGKILSVVEEDLPIFFFAIDPNNEAREINASRIIQSISKTLFNKSNICAISLKPRRGLEVESGVTMPPFPEEPCLKGAGK